MDATAPQIDRPILITGAARSRTSMTAGIFHMCGAWGGSMRSANQHNKKGMFENAEIVDQIVKPYLIESGADPMGQDPLPHFYDLEPMYDLGDRVKEAIKGQGYEGGKWFYKGAKLCLIYPVWVQAFPNAKWIIVRRKDEGIVSSCMRTSFMRRRGTEEAWQESSDRMIEGDFSEIKDAIEWCGLEWDERKVTDFIDVDLTRK
jgi:hypothetical protein